MSAGIRDIRGIIVVLRDRLTGESRAGERRPAASAAAAPDETFRLLSRSGETGRQFVKFFIVGGANLVLDFAVYLALTRLTSFWHEHFVGAASVSFICAVLSSYFANTFWTFRRKEANLRRGIKFFAVALAGLAWNAFIIALLTGAGMYDIFAKLIATSVVLCWNFSMQKWWTFRA